MCTLEVAHGHHQRHQVHRDRCPPVKLESPFIPGKTTRGRMTYPGFEHVVLEVVVQKVEPETFFSFTWHPYAVDPKIDYSKEKQTVVEFRLSTSASGTRLHVTESGFDGIPALRRDEAFRMHTAGWEEQLNNIKAYLTR
jgi:uncharacterized protein YndB with AHSA1/START domain